MNKRTPKGGAGPHNWGSLSNERDLEDAAMFDQEGEEAEGMSRFLKQFYKQQLIETSAVEPEVPPAGAGENRRTSSASVTDEERKEALKFRKNALKSPGAF